MIQSWRGVRYDPDVPFTQGTRGFASEEAARVELERLGYEVVDFKTFWLTYFRRFYKQEDLTWEQAVKRSGWDPLGRGVRKARSGGSGTPKSTTGGGSIKRKVGWGSGREGEAEESSSEPEQLTPEHQGEGGRVLPTGRVLGASELPPEVEGVPGGSDWIAPVAYAKQRGIPPQYVYGLISRGRLETKGERPKLIRKSQADKYWGSRGRP